MQPFTVFAPTADLAAMLITAADRDVRFYLNSVCLRVTPEHTYWVSTDGHRLTLLRTDRPKGALDGDYIFPRADLESLLKSAPKAAMLSGTAIFTLDPETRMVDAVFAGNSRRFALTDATYPPIEPVLPDVATAYPYNPDACQLNVHYLADAEKQAQLFGKGKLNKAISLVYVSWHARVNLDRPVAVVRYDVGRDDSVGIIMPLRLTPPDAWLDLFPRTK